MTSGSNVVGMSVDEAYQALGTGRFTIVMYLVLCLNFMYVPMHIFGDLFNTRVPPHHCKEMTKIDHGHVYHRHHVQTAHALKLNRTLESDDDIRKIDDDDDSDSSEEDDEESEDGNYVVPERSQVIDKYGYYYKDRTCHLTLLHRQHGNKTTECRFGHWFDTSYTGETVVSEFELVCEKNSEVIFITIHGVAAVLGAVIFAPFSDKYGRKALLLMCWSQMALMSLGMYFVGDMSSYLVLRFLQRLYVEGAEQAIFILSCEMLPTNLRPNAVSGLYIFYGLGYLVLSLKAYLATDWRYLQLAVAIGSFILLPINFVLPESPYWLVFMGREKSAEKFFREAAKRNKTKLPANFNLKREVVEDDGAEVDEVKRLQQRHHFHHGEASTVSNNLCSGDGEQELSPKKLGTTDFSAESRHTIHPHVGHFKELFQALSNKMLRKEAGIASFTWAVSAFLYYGITVSGFSPGEDAYLNFFLSGVAVIVSSSSTTFILRRFGRKKPITAFCFLCAIFMLLKSTIPYKIDGAKLKSLHKILKFLAKLFAAAIVSSTQLIVAELFPTTVRSTCVGLVSFFGLLGAGLGMYFSILERVSLKGSTIGAGVLTLLAGYLCRGLPETSNRPLPGTIVDLMDSYASVMEAIVLMMNKMPGGSDVTMADAISNSRSSSVKFKRNSEKNRRKSSASIMNLKRIVSEKRRPSIPVNIYKNVKSEGVRFEKGIKEEEKNVKMAQNNWRQSTEDVEKAINTNSDDCDLVTKF